MKYDPGSLAERYERLTARRDPALDRAREFCRYTLPFLMPDEASEDGSYEFAEPFNSIAARGVNNLANKHMLSLFPTGMPIFKLEVPPSILRESEKLVPGSSDQIKTSLSGIERDVTSYIETLGLRPELYQAMRLLVATGNACLWLRPDDRMTCHDLSEYVVQRDTAGTLLAVVICESVSRASVSPEILAKIDARAEEADDIDGELELYSGFVLKDGAYEGWQEVEGERLPDKSWTAASAEDVPMIPIRFHRVKRHSYGHGRVEEFFGDIRSAESLQESIVGGAAAAARVLWMVNPTGYTRARDLDRADNGEYVPGNPEDVKALTLEKYADFRFATESLQALNSSLGKAFLLMSGSVRDSERTTAEEVRFLAQELEDTLGGAYSVQTQELQLPFIKILMARMKKKGMIPDLPEQVKVHVVTGVEALGRGHELGRLQAAFGTLNALGVTAEAAATEMNMNTIIQRVLDSAGVDTTGLLKTPEKKAADQAAATRAALVDRGTAPVINQAGQILQQQMAPQGQAQ